MFMIAKNHSTEFLKEYPMKKILYGMALAVLCTVFLLAGPGKSDEYSAGKDLFKRNCQFCHHIKGDDNYPSAYYMQYRPKDFTDPDSWKGVDAQKIAKVIKEGKGAMPAIILTPEQTKAIIDYMTSSLK